MLCSGKAEGSNSQPAGVCLRQVTLTKLKARKHRHRALQGRTKASAYGRVRTVAHDLKTLKSYCKCHPGALRRVVSKGCIRMDTSLVQCPTVSDTRSGCIAETTRRTCTVGVQQLVAPALRCLRAVACGLRPAACRCRGTRKGVPRQHEAPLGRCGAVLRAVLLG